MNIYSQNKRVFEYMKEHGEISQREAYKLGIYRLSGRIFDLKARGTAIVTTIRTVTNADGSRSRVAFYKLAEV